MNSIRTVTFLKLKKDEFHQRSRPTTNQIAFLFRIVDWHCIVSYSATTVAQLLLLQPTSETFCSSEKGIMSLHLVSQSTPWLIVLIIECLAIVILNIITVVVFVKKKRQLQRRSTYLIIHLAIVDLLVGAVSGPLQIEIRMATFCNLWTYNGEPRLSFFFF